MFSISENSCHATKTRPPFVPATIYKGEARAQIHSFIAIRSDSVNRTSLKIQTVIYYSVRIKVQTVSVIRIPPQLPSSFTITSIKFLLKLLYNYYHA